MAKEKKYKNINVKVDERLVERVNYYRGLDPNGEMSQADFVIKALEEKCNKTRAIRKGSKLIEIPNLDLRGISKENEEKVLDIIFEAMTKIGKVDSGLNLGLEEIMIFIKRHSLMSEKEKSDILAQGCDDMAFEEGDEE